MEPGRIKSKEDQSPLITVVTVVLNGVKYLEQAIKSVISQNYDNIEYIIIDGGSTDGTLEIIRKYEDRIDLWISEPDRGIYDAMNKGIEMASGEFIAFLNADDWYEQNIVNDVKDKVNSFSSAGKGFVVYFNYYWWDEELSTGFKSPRQSDLRYWKGMSILHQCMFVHKSIYKKLGAYDLEYRFASDYDYFLRMIEVGVTFKKINRYGVNFRKGGTSTMYMNRSITEVSRIIRKYYGVWSREYALFLLTNRLPSILGNIGDLLSKIIGKENTIKLRKIRRKLTPGGRE